MIIRLDNREADLLNACKFIISCSPSFKDLQIEVVNLPIGDAILVDEKEENEELREKVIIERKSLNDLAASIKDGRYEEQSYRLNGADVHNHNIIYLIEGDLTKFNLFKQRMDKMTLYSSIISLNYYKGFSVFRSNDIQETAIIICNMAYKLAKGARDGKIPFYKNRVTQNATATAAVNPVINANNIELDSANQEQDQNQPVESHNSETNNNDENIHDEKDYCSVVKKVKKENVTAENIGEIMLCQIPGISSVSAIAIMKHFKTIGNLFSCIKTDEGCLKDISYVNSKGQTRKISKTVIVNIAKYLHP
jgi:ERCC4-type nuclease